MLVVLVGIPGSGKSTYAQAHFRTIISPDTIRLDRFGEAFNREYEDEVWREAYARTAERLAAGQVVCFDATSATPRRRRMLIALAETAQRPAVAVYFDIPIDTAWDRNAARPQPVPRAAFWQLARALQPPTLDEGFAAISVIREATGA